MKHYNRPDLLGSPLALLSEVPEGFTLLDNGLAAADAPFSRAPGVYVDPGCMGFPTFAAFCSVVMVVGGFMTTQTVTANNIGQTFTRVGSFGGWDPWKLITGPVVLSGGASVPSWVPPGTVIVRTES